MTIEEALGTGTQVLQQAGIGTARLDTLVLLGDVTGSDRSFLLAHPGHQLTKDQDYRLRKQLDRRKGHEPLAYIRNISEFYGREFYIDHAVLEPRPESETMIDLLKAALGPETRAQILDVGTGSGSLAITASLECPTSVVTAIDIDPRCLKVAQKNAASHAANITFLRGDLLDDIQISTPDTPYFILANLPYVPTSYSVNEAATWEPKHAIFGGEDGLDLYRDMFLQLSNSGAKNVTVLTESLPFQHAQLLEIAQALGFSQVKQQDFIQQFEWS